MREVDGVRSPPRLRNTAGKSFLGSGPHPWPKAVPGQLRAIRDLLPTRAGTWTLEEVAAAFKGKPKATVRRHLEALEALGHLVAYDDAAGRVERPGRVRMRPTYQTNDRVSESDGRVPPCGD